MLSTPLLLALLLQCRVQTCSSPGWGIVWENLLGVRIYSVQKYGICFPHI